MTTCSAATAMMLVNAMRSGAGLDSCSIDEVLKTDISGRWKDQVKDLTCKGISLHAFAQLVAPCVGQLTPWEATVEAHPVRDTVASTTASIQSLLVNFEEDESLYIACNFLQSGFLKDGFEVGHLSLVGGYDAANGYVAVLDVDVRGLPPYWVPLASFCAGLKTYDTDAEDYRGLVSVRVSLVPGLWRGL
jgi:hypothetical protein